MGFIVAKVLFRLIIGFGVALALTAIALLSGFPYGGGSRSLIEVVWLAIIGTIIWAVVPIFDKRELDPKSQHNIPPDGAWQCELCYSVNSISSTHCRGCSAARSATVGSSAVKDRSEMG